MRATMEFAQRTRPASWPALTLCFVLLLLCGCKSELLGNLNEADANAVLDALYSEGMSAEKVARERDVWAIEVAESDLPRAVRLTQERRLPRARFTTMGELFKKEGLVSSPSEERLRYIFAVSQELSNTLTQIDGVITARVHPVIPANDPLADKVKPASASVFIKHQAQADLQQMAPAIRNMVSRSIEGLTPDNVALTFVVASSAPVRIAPSHATGWQESAQTWLIAALTLCLLALAALLVYIRLQSRSKKRFHDDARMGNPIWSAPWTKPSFEAEPAKATLPITPS